MHIIIGVGAAIALLYFWLLGHWFARILMCIVLGSTFGLIALVACVDKHPEGAILLVLIGGGAGWAISSIPVWYWRERLGIA
jgi:hypothetical protein